MELTPFMEEYNKAVEEAINVLHDFEEQLFNASLGVLLTGRWRKWADAQPIGTVFNFREKEMLEAGDKNVNELLELKVKVEEVLGMMEGL